MSITKTLGGDRLGSGKKMKVTMHGYDRSTHDLSYLWRSSMSAGTLVPFMKFVAQPGDTWDIELDIDIKTHPTIGPLFGSYKASCDIFFAAIRLYQGMLHNNKLGIGNNMKWAKLPQMELPATVIPTDGSFTGDIDNAQINPSCILAYLGIRGVGINIPAFADTPRLFNAVAFIAYWDTIKNYYINKQEENAYVIHTPQAANPQNVDEVVIYFAATNATGITLPFDSAVGSTAALGPQGRIDIFYTPWPTPVPNLNGILLHTADGKIFSVEELRAGAANATQTDKVIIYFDSNKYPNGIGTITHWTYAEATTLPKLAPRLEPFPVTNLDLMRENILTWATAGPTAPPFTLEGGGVPSTPTPYRYVLESGGTYNNMLSTQEGLAVKTYQSDLFNNWLNSETFDAIGTGINAITSVSTAGGSFTVDALNMAKKVWELLNRVAVSGGSYMDWIETVYDQENYFMSETPMFMGGLIRELVFQEVVSNSQTNTPNGEQPLGTIAGKGVMAQKRKGGTVIVKPREHGYILGIVSLTPRIDYSQGNDWDVHLLTMDDFHKPALDEIGFQELPTERLAWWDTHRIVGGDGTFVQLSAGKLPAWIEYMTNVNRCYGNFAIESNEMFMTLNRRYEPTEGLHIKDLTTYIDPTKFNNIFAQTSLDAQNFWVQIACNVTARRKMSAKLIPNL